MPSKALAIAAAACLSLAAVERAEARQSPAPPPQSPASPAAAPEAPAASAVPVPVYVITGVVHTGKSALPGVTVTAANTLTGKKFTTTTGLDGRFSFTLTARGRYVVRADFLAFAPQTQEVLLNPQNPTAKVDLEMTLASRVEELQQEQQAARASNANMGAGRGFQNLGGAGGLSDLGAGGAGESAGGNGPGGAGAADLSELPFSGAGAEAATESVVSGGGLGQSENFGIGSDAQIQERINEYRERVAAGGGGGFGGPGGGFGGGGGPMGGPGILFRAGGGRGFNINQPHGAIYFSDDNAGLDASPFSINGAPVAKASYNQARFGAILGGPLNIPKIYHGGTKTFFFFNYNGSRASNPYDAYSIVPTLDERMGIFPGLTVPTTSFTQAAKVLLNYIPEPNVTIANSPLNYHYVTSGQNDSDAINIRLIHNFGGGGPILLGPGGGGGGGRRRRQGQNINFGMNYSRTNSQILTPFPQVAGTTGTQGLNASAGYSYNKGRLFSLLRFNYNHLHTSTSNLYAYNTNIEGMAGISTGVPISPFEYGLPNLSFSDLQGINDPSPRRSLNQTYTVSETLGWSHGKHSVRFGGDYRRILQNLLSAQNARGSFTFTGYSTGNDFADFLLGLPQLTSLQTGTTAYDFRSNSFDLYGQDEWKATANISMNFGVRYEYQGPFNAANNQIVNLDFVPNLSCVEPVFTGEVGGCTGQFYSNSLVRPDRNNWAPRIGVAWKPAKRVVVRAGYGWNYNLAQYASLIQQLAFQPPFAVTATNTIAACPGITLADGFSSCAPPSVTNNYAVDPNYRLGYVQLWNLDVQTELGRGVLMNIGYNGSKGTHLDLVEAPNRTATGVVNSAVQPFLFETSDGNSIYHGLSVRIRKRLQGGIAVSGVYVYSKSIDDASSIGGGAVVVAQNAADISAERGLSSFDQRHRFTGTWIYELPFGDGKKYVQTGPWSHVLGGWLWSGDWTFATGTPLSPRIVGSFSEVNSGTSGTLRPDLVPGQAITVANPGIREWFNTAAFEAPTAGQFGNAGRNIIPGPGEILFDMSISKTFQFQELRSLEVRATANNVFNHVNFSTVDTNLNSPTFGQVIGVGTMRRVSFLARFRF